MSRLVRLGIKLLKSSCWHACLSDKDGCFVLVDKSIIEQLHVEALVPPVYQAQHRMEMHHTSIIAGLRKLAKRVAVAEGCTMLEGEILSDLRKFGFGSLASRVLLTIKTRKPPGAVTTRKIHASRRSYLAPLGKFISIKLRESLCQYPHIFQSTDDLIRAIVNTRVTANAVMVKCDVKDFFITGDHEHLAARAALSVPESERRIIHDCIAFLLDNQWVKSFEIDDPNLVFKVTQGSGMGINASGEISDSAFLQYYELGFMLDPRIKEKFGILMYGRYRDDMFFIIERFGGNIVSCIEAWRQHARKSPYRVDSLDITVFKGKRWQTCGILDIRPFSKPTSRHVPLASWSAHSRAVHRGWPVARIHSLRAHSSCSAYFEHAKAAFIHKLAMHQAPALMLERLKAMSYADKPCRAGGDKVAERHVVRLKLPGHSVIQALSLRSFMTEFMGNAVSAVLQAVWPEAAFLKLDVCYRQSLPHFHVKIRK